MIVAIFHGSRSDTATDMGAMHFDTLPSRGDEIEIDRRTYIVQRVWHLPSTALYAEPKTAILIDSRSSEPAERDPIANGPTGNLARGG